jgi:outer membrane protein OmpA-like peptidoglycan-associated protein
MSRFEALRELLLAPEQERLRAQAEQLAAIEARDEQLAERLPALLDAAQQSAQSAALHRALAPAVEQSLLHSVKRNPGALVEALFPVMGPSIRKAIAETLRALIHDVNLALEHSFTPRGLRWRLEAWRTGTPFAHVVFKYTVRFKVDHLFLIHREDGLLVHRLSSPELSEIDADAVAGMLTAIGDFVRDSVGANAPAQQGLSAATVGEHQLIVLEGPRFLLACFVRGVPPPSLTLSLQNALERFHAEFQDAGDPTGTEAGVAQAETLLAPILTESAAYAPPPAPARWPLLLVGGLLAILLLGWGLQSWQQARSAAALREAIRATPGWELLTLQHDGVWQARALRDPDAAPAARLLAAAGIAADQVHWQLSPYLSLHPELILTRARRVLNPPPGVQVDFEDGALILRGSADADWVATARLHARLLPGVAALRDDALQTQPVVSDADQLARAREALARSVLPFASGTTELRASAESLDTLAQHAQAALSAADRLGLPVVLLIEGWSDDSGSERRNTRLRGARAEVLRDALLRRGVAVERLQLDLEGRALAPSPGARLRVQLLDPEQE